MGKGVLVLLVGLLPSIALAGKDPPAKEWQPLIDAATDAVKKKDAAAVAKLIVSHVEMLAACDAAKTPGDKQRAEETDKNRSASIARALDDCRAGWKSAKLVSSEGGAPSPSKCARAKFAKPINLEYDDGTLLWQISLDPMILDGKRLLVSPPRCLASMRK